MEEEDAFTKARMELEALYEGVPDESVNLTFRHLTDIKLHPNSSLEMKKMNSSIPSDNQSSTRLSKLPSIDFNRGLQAANQHFRPDAKISLHPSAQVAGVGVMPQPHESQHIDSKSHYLGGFRQALENSVGSMHHRGPTGRRRPGIPHSNICTNCSTYIYIFRHRCLVCGRVYCRQCVRIGMGEMTEGRKCIECLGRKFSHRYIARAGDVGCCVWRYSSMVKQAELKWAEKGSRRKGEKPMQRGYGHGVSGLTNSMTSTSPVTFTSQSQSPWAATSMDASTISNHHFAVMSSPYSPAHRHYIPF